ncbi:hypothetical protein HDU84_001006 [Entophlyctis sp. JEL0112]|nr:hypothetical protein HDU84_001006 [Entophlyctis sp. JEL0112]
MRVVTATTHATQVSSHGTTTSSDSSSAHSLQGKFYHLARPFHADISKNGWTPWQLGARDSKPASPQWRLPLGVRPALPPPRSMCYGLSPALVRLTVVVGSLTAQCAYCSGVGCGFGDIFNGAIAVDEPIDLRPVSLSNDRFAMRAVVAATKVPARVTPVIRRDALGIFGGLGGLQTFAYVVGSVGFTNTLNTLLGSELDEAYYKRALTAFPVSSGYVAGIHAFAQRFKSSFTDSSLFKQLWDNAIFLGQMGSLQEQAKKIRSAVPDTHQGIDSWLIQQFGGFAPRYLSTIIDLRVKQNIVAAISRCIFWEAGSAESANFDQSEFPELPMRDRLVLAYVYMEAARNSLLASHFAAAAAARFGVDVDELQHAVDTAKHRSQSHTYDFETDGPFTLLLTLTYFSARRFHQRTWRLAPSLANTFTPSTALAFIALVSCLTFLHRFSAVVDDEQGSEPGVLNILKRNMGGFACMKGFVGADDSTDLRWEDVDIVSVLPRAARLREALLNVTGGSAEDAVWSGVVQY